MIKLFTAAIDMILIGCVFALLYMTYTIGSDIKKCNEIEDYILLASGLSFCIGLIVLLIGVIVLLSN